MLHHVRRFFQQYSSSFTNGRVNMNQSLARGSRQTSNKIPMSHSIVVLVSLINFFLLGAFFFYLYIIRIQNADNASFFYLSLWLQKNLMRSSIVVLRCLILFIIIFSFYKNSKCYIMYFVFFEQQFMYQWQSQYEPIIGSREETNFKISMMHSTLMLCFLFLFIV